MSVYVKVASDATRVEEAFELKLSVLMAAETGDSVAVDGPADVVSAPTVPTGGDGTLATDKPRRYRNKEHLRYVARQACLVCGRQPSDPHHLRYAQPRALGRKASDEFTVPLCRVQHREAHRVGNEQAWWQGAGIDPLSVAQTLWNRTRVNEGRIEEDETHRLLSGTATDPIEKASKRAPKAQTKRSCDGQPRQHRPVEWIATR
jgi:hypothetical protein